jgi:hypothetical protein
MDSTFVVGLVGWIFPGGGHLLQKRWTRGAILAFIFWAMFAIALASGGAHYPGFSFQDGQLLVLLNGFARLGSGLGAVLGYLAAVDAPRNIAALPTFEYGGRFLEVAGLINFLAVLDAVDISLGRKK